MVHRCGLLQDRCSPTPHSPSPQTLAHRFARHTYRTHYYYSRTTRVDRPESRHESRPVTLHHALSCRARLGAQASNGVAPIYQLPPVSGDLPSRRRHHHRHVRGTGTCGSEMVPFLVYVPPRQDLVTLGTPVTTLASPDGGGVLLQRAMQGREGGEAGIQLLALLSKVGWGGDRR